MNVELRKFEFLNGYSVEIIEKQKEFYALTISKKG